MKNTLTDPNNRPFEQLERLNDDEGMTKVATQIIQNPELAYKTMAHTAAFTIQRKGLFGPREDVTFCESFPMRRCGV